MRKLITIGELADILAVNASTIRYYEREGLITPSKIDNNNYRLYDFDKIERMEHLLLLKNLGIPLKELKELVDNYSVEKYNSILESSICKIEQNIGSLTAMKSLVTKKLSYTRGISDAKPSFEMLKYPKRTLVLLYQGDLLKISIKEFYDYMKQYPWLEYSRIDCSYIQPYGDEYYSSYIDSLLFPEAMAVCERLHLKAGKYLSYGFFLEIDKTLKNKNEIIAAEDDLIDQALEIFKKYIKENDLLLSGEILYKQMTRSSKFELYSAYTMIEGLVENL